MCPLSHGLAGFSQTFAAALSLCHLHPTIGDPSPYPMKNSNTKKYCTQCIINNNLLSCIGFFGFHLIGPHPGEGGNVDYAFSEVLRKSKKI